MLLLCYHRPTSYCCHSVASVEFRFIYLYRSPLNAIFSLLTTHFMAHFRSLLLLLLCCILIVVMRKIVQNVGTKIHLLSCKPYIKVWYLISYRRMRHLWFLYRWSLTHFSLFEYSNTWCASNNVIHRIHTFISWYTMKYNSAKLYSMFIIFYLSHRNIRDIV